MLTSATEEPEKLWDAYRRAFEKVRAGPVEQLDERWLRKTGLADK